MKKHTMYAYIYILGILVLLLQPVIATEIPLFNVENYNKVEVKENKFLRMIKHADRQHQLRPCSRHTFTSNREYLDCAGLREVDCANFYYCRCWQCREYKYNYVWK